MFAGNIPEGIEPLVYRNACAQLQVAKAAHERDLEQAFIPFMNDPLVDLPEKKARELFDKMVENTRHYLKEYEK